MAVVDRRLLDAYEQCRTDFRFFSKNCLKIKDKLGNTVPFQWNSAQEMLHAKLEEQKRRTGRVRVMICKGRQQGCCLAPKTRVLMADLTWREIQYVKPGERVVACDENPNGRVGRRMRTANVEVVATTIKDAARITFSDGRTLVTSLDHRWLGRKSQVQGAWRTFGTGGKTKLVAGDQVRSVTEPWEVGDGEDGWVGGLIDGEGSFATKKETGFSVRVSQRDGAVLQRLRKYVSERNYTFGETEDCRVGGVSKLGRKPVFGIEFSRMRELFRIMGQCRPSRMPSDWWDGKKLPGDGNSWTTVEKVELIGEQVLYDLQTSEKTFVAEGLVSHNSTYIGARFYHNTTMNRGRNTFILSHKKDTTDALAAIVERYQINNPFAPQKGKDNVLELEFPRLDASYYLETAGAASSGRGKTSLNFHGCLSPNTWIMDPCGGARRMRDFKVGEVVYTHTGALAPISFISRKRADAYAVRVLGANVPLIATGEHKFVTRLGKKRLDELGVGDELMHPVTSVKSERVTWPYRLKYASRPQGGGTGSVGPDELEATFELGRILGLYLAEGHVSRNRVSFTVHEKEVERTLKWLQPFSRCWRKISVERRASKAVNVTVNSRSFAAFVEARCSRVAGKHLPSEWARNADFARGLVTGYFSGDGGGQFDKTTRRVQAPSVLPSLAFGMRDALAALGYGWSSLVRREGALRNGRDEKTQWTVRLSGEGADRLWTDMGREPLERTNKVREANFKIEDGAAWFPITGIEPVGEVEVMDFEVAHEDHTYRTWQCAVSNSEVAFWTNASAHFSGSVQTVPDMDGTEVALESTANGVTGAFYERTQDAIQRRGDYELCFIPWFLQTEYVRRVPEGFELAEEAEGAYSCNIGLSERQYAELFELSNEQMVWRRNKIHELKAEGGLSLFDQEYPATVELAFQQKAEGAYHKVIDILRARKRTDIHAGGPLILGVDPAGEGGDRFAIAFRRGHVCEKIIWRDKIAHDEAVAWLKSVIDEANPALVFIDAGGLGKAIISSLRAKGPAYNLPRVHAVNFGGKSQSKMARPNMPGPKMRRDEMQQRVAEWLALSEGVSIPDIDTLQADLIELRIKKNSTNDLQLESKQEIKGRGGRSPDLADALGLTFADQVFVRNYTEPKQQAAFMQDARKAAIIQPSSDEVVEYGEFGYGGGSGGWMG